MWVSQCRLPYPEESSDSVEDLEEGALDSAEDPEKEPLQTTVQEELRDSWLSICLHPQKHPDDLMAMLAVRVLGTPSALEIVGKAHASDDRLVEGSWAGQG